MKATTIVAIVSFAGAGAIASLDAATRSRSPAAMTRAAAQFLTGLTAEQRTKAAFAFADSERFNWHFIPRTRLGLPYKQMTEPQRTNARVLLQTGLSQAGMRKADNIIELELVLREMGGSATMRDPEQYFFSVFGSPSETEPWGWRFEGHHMSLNFTVHRNSLVATSPSFMGANPARVPSGSRQGLRALAGEEDLARALVRSLDAAQQTAAIMPGAAPTDIITMNSQRANPLEPGGIAASALRPDQTTMLLQVIDEYLVRMADDVASERRTKLQQSDFSRVTFLWAGSMEPGQRHYYRIQGQSFLIEYDNTQNNANHIHSVWRDFNGDFGRDLLREHYSTTPHDR